MSAHDLNLSLASVTAAAGAVAATAAEAADTSGIEELLANVRSSDVNVRGAAWAGAAKFGPAALKPLAKVAAEGDLEVRRAATRAMWTIVRHVGRPGADQEKTPAAVALVELLADDQPTSVRRDVLWMVSEIGGDDSVPATARLLAHAELREDARMVLQRIPGDKSLAALQAGLAEVPEEARPAVAQSLRARGVAVDAYPSAKLTPSRQTQREDMGGL